MHGHGNRAAYYIKGEGIFEEPAYLSPTGRGCPFGSSGHKCSPYKFGRLFPRNDLYLTAQEWDDLLNGLVHLGLAMNDPQKYLGQPAPEAPEDSTIPSGYTYLGQFIAHEITFDNTQDLPLIEPDPENLRSPGIDLDSLYGPMPISEENRSLYDGDDPALFKIGKTSPPGEIKMIFENDLPRDEKTREALIGDPRNDVNLAVAQTHVALLKFHNRVVERLKSEGHASNDLFDCARIQVIRHFQWIILHDYLPRIVDKSVLECVVEHGNRWFRIDNGEDAFMPLEFSAAAFRFGHSMVRDAYHWNLYHPSGLSAISGSALSDLFDQTEFSGIIGESQDAVRSDWVIDWKRFYEFPADLGYSDAPAPGVNRARKIDPYFDFRLNQVNFDHHGLPEEKRSITVRNLLRGFALGLPAGEEVARWMGEVPIKPADLTRGPHADLLKKAVFKDRTPLWYYILKEAELTGGSRLGRVGSRIVAETLVGLIRNSSYSILDVPSWYPRYTRRGVPGTASAVFEMVDLLDFAGVVEPIEVYMRSLASNLSSAD